MIRLLLLYSREDAIKPIKEKVTNFKRLSLCARLLNKVCIDDIKKAEGILWSISDEIANLGALSSYKESILFKDKVCALVPKGDSLTFATVYRFLLKHKAILIDEDNLDELIERMVNLIERLKSIKAPAKDKGSHKTF